MTNELDDLFDSDNAEVEEEDSEIEVREEQKTKMYDIKWKSKIARGLRLVNVALERIFHEQLKGEETQLLAEEWEDVLGDVLKQGPLLLKVGIAVFMTLAVAISYVSRIKTRLNRENTGEARPTQDDTSKS